MSQELCMQFIVWSYYYHTILPKENESYKECGCFTDEDAERLDALKETMFKCFTQESVTNACFHLLRAKNSDEPCVWSQEELDAKFAKEIEG